MSSVIVTRIHADKKEVPTLINIAAIVTANPDPEHDFTWITVKRENHKHLPPSHQSNTIDSPKQQNWRIKEDIYWLQEEMRSYAPIEEDHMELNSEAIEAWRKSHD